MKTMFWLLDVNYEVKDHKSEIWIWGIDENNQRLLIIDRNFLPYFYLVVKQKENPQPIMETLESLKADYPLIKRLELVNRRFFGRSVTAIKVVCQDPNVMSKYARSLEQFKGIKSRLEDDIRYSMRYLIDNNVIPCSWHEIEVEEIENNIGVQVDKLYVANTFPRTMEKTEIPKLRILAFSTISYSRQGAPRPEKNPVIIISMCTNVGDEKQFVAKNSDDKDVIESFVKYVRNFDPDILAGYGTNRQDWPYLLFRSKKLGIQLSVTRANTEPHRSVYGHISVTGRSNIDLFSFADELPEVKIKTLENVADFFGVMKLQKRTLIEDIDFPSYWETPEKRSILLKFSNENTQSITGIARAMLDFAVQLSSLVSLPLDHVGTAAVGFRVEWYLIKEAYRIGELVPKKRERPYIPYAGGVVLKPKPGVHENVTILDFKAMYPNIMITENLSPDTYVSPSEPEPACGVNITPEVKHRFRKEPAGFYKVMLSNLIAIRDRIRLEMKQLGPKSAEYRASDAGQTVIKVITNALYGYTGWIGARWYMKPVAEAAAAWGRHSILNTIELAKEIGLEVIYGDTDSIFVKYEPDKVERLSEIITENFGLEIKPDQIYIRILFTEAKKRYCGLLPDGSLDTVGLEVVRGDWAAVAKNVQEKVLEIILKEQTPLKAARFVRQSISDLRKKKVPYKDLIIWKTLAKPIKAYKVRAPHIEAAKRLKEAGWDISVGDKIGYVIVAGSGRLHERAKPHVLAAYDDVDIEYYITKQLVPVASRILTLFNIGEDTLIPSRTPKTLLEFAEN